MSNTMSNEEIITENVSSSTIDKVDFDPLMETIKVHFRNGSSYEYYGISKALFEQFVTAPSVGKFFAKEIKSKFDFAKRSGWKRVENDSSQLEIPGTTTATKEQ